MNRIGDEAIMPVSTWPRFFATTISGTPFIAARLAHVWLVRLWNKYLPKINGEPRNVGRPLAASEAAPVLKLHREGYSLRGIAEETSLGFNTVRTIVSKKDGTDRTH